MQVTVMDERGRITLGKKIGKRYGRRFIVVPGNGEVVLMPALRNKDPVKGLEEWGRKTGINRHSIKELRKIAMEEAEKEALSGMR